MVAFQIRRSINAGAGSGFGISAEKIILFFCLFVYGYRSVCLAKRDCSVQRASVVTAKDVCIKHWTGTYTFSLSSTQKSSVHIIIYYETSWKHSKILQQTLEYLRGEGGYTVEYSKSIYLLCLLFGFAQENIQMRNYTLGFSLSLPTASTNSVFSAWYQNSELRACVRTQDMLPYLFVFSLCSQYNIDKHT